MKRHQILASALTAPFPRKSRRANHEAGNSVLYERIRQQTRFYSNLGVEPRVHIQWTQYDFKTIAPGGLTLDETLNATPDVPGVKDFPVGITFAGNCLAVGSESKDER
jgi:hypothetical protein